MIFRPTAQTLLARHYGTKNTIGHTTLASGYFPVGSSFSSIPLKNPNSSLPKSKKASFAPSNMKFDSSSPNNQPHLLNNGLVQPIIKITENLLWSYIVQIASCLKAIHDNGLVYRILDLSKILVSGRNRYCKFICFCFYSLMLFLPLEFD